MKEIQNTYDIDEHYRLDLYPTPRVWSNRRGRYLSVYMHRHGYLGVKLYTAFRTIHSLVAEFCIGPRPFNKEVNHIDGNKLNNHYSNLEYVTKAENIKHAVALGLHVAADPKRSGRYKDGRCADLVAYKRNWARQKALKDSGGN